MTSTPVLSCRNTGFLGLFRRRSVRLALLGWLVVNALLIGFAGDHLPFHASSLADPPTVDAVVNADMMILEVFVLMVVVHLITRRRAVPDIAERAPDRDLAKRETLGVLGYGCLAMLGGYALAHTFGWHAFGFHLENMVVRTDQKVVPAEALSWAGYNFLAYVVVPFAYFRRRYSAEQLSLRSSNRRADLIVILVILAIESTVQLSLASSTILDVGLRQALIGGPLTFAIGFAGTVLPTMVFIYCILTPRYLRLTGSVPATVVLGGLTYAALHIFDGWTNFTSPTDMLLSGLYVVLFYTGPGMFKTFITIRTANAWSHVWAYHAIAPHTLVDTPMMVKVFGIR